MRGAGGGVAGGAGPPGAGERPSGRHGQGAAPSRGADAILGVSTAGGFPGNSEPLWSLWDASATRDSVYHCEGLCVREGCLPLRGSCRVGPQHSSVTGFSVSPEAPLFMGVFLCRDGD